MTRSRYALATFVVLALLVAAIVATVVVVRRRASTSPAPLPTIALGPTRRDEGCLLCHAQTSGLGAAHAAIGCSPCHLGDPTARDAALAHRGMEVLAGNLASVFATCGQSACHPVEAARVRTSLMARAPGILAVDRFAFGERATPEGTDADDLSRLDVIQAPASPAESHARQLCASCHLAAKKERPGDLGPAARGGGCTACHLAAPVASGTSGASLHPDVSAAVSERRCEGCHARSGRIALSFHGVVELEPGDPRVTGKLPDGRTIGAASADVHALAGMTCIDCHTEREVMGDGSLHRHAHEARDVTCETCHRATASAPSDDDREAVAARLRVAWLRRRLPALSTTPIRTVAGTPLVRTNVAPPSLLLATTGVSHAIPQASTKAHHRLPGHERLGCSACHAAWAPRCPSCHTRFDPSALAVDLSTSETVKGAWIEEAGGNGFGPPLLALGPTGRIEPFVEGMRLRIDAGDAGDAGKSGAIERTLFAPLEPHTTSAARACPSCHAPKRLEDVYPLLGEVTRVGARLLDAAERDRVVEVGKCLACHARAEDAIYLDFRASVVKRRTHAAPLCKDPAP